MATVSMFRRPGLVMAPSPGTQPLLSRECDYHEREVVLELARLGSLRDRAMQAFRFGYTRQCRLDQQGQEVRHIPAQLVLRHDFEHAIAEEIHRAIRRHGHLGDLVFVSPEGANHQCRHAEWLWRLALRRDKKRRMTTG